jgi:hypothetical protein
MEIITYSFKARGTTPEGNKVVLDGYVNGLPGYPMAVFELARKTCEDLCPGIKFKGDEPNQTTFPVLRALKTRRL